MRYKKEHVEADTGSGHSEIDRYTALCQAGAGSLIYVADTGFIIENVYLYCAAEGLPTTVRTAIDNPALAKTMKLRPDQKITVA